MTAMLMLLAWLLPAAASPACDQQQNTSLRVGAKPPFSGRRCPSALAFRTFGFHCADKPKRPDPALHMALHKEPCLGSTKAAVVIKGGDPRRTAEG